MFGGWYALYHRKPGRALGLCFGPFATQAEAQAMLPAIPAAMAKAGLTLEPDDFPACGYLLTQFLIEGCLNAHAWVKVDRTEKPNAP